MRSIIAIIAALALAFTCAPVEITENAANTITLGFDANATTGYYWTAFVLGGESAVIDEENSGYVMDDNPGMLDGVGGTHYFTVNAVQPGETIIRFTYARGFDEISTEIFMLFTVDEEMNIIIVKGAIPGGKNGIVRVRMA